MTIPYKRPLKQSDARHVCNCPEAELCHGGCTLDAHVVVATMLTALFGASNSSTIYNRIHIFKVFC